MEKLANTGQLEPGTLRAYNDAITGSSRRPPDSGAPSHFQAFATAETREHVSSDPAQVTSSAGPAQAPTTLAPAAGPPSGGARQPPSGSSNGRTRRRRRQRVRRNTAHPQRPARRPPPPPPPRGRRRPTSSTPPSNARRSVRRRRGQGSNSGARRPPPPAASKGSSVPRRFGQVRHCASFGSIPPRLRYRAAWSRGRWGLWYHTTNSGVRLTITGGVYSSLP